MFPDFDERTVTVSHKNKSYTIAKLSILNYSRIMRIIKECEQSMEPSACSAASIKIWNILRNKLPKAIYRDRSVFTFDELIDFILFLAFGSLLNDQITEDITNTYEPTEQPDYQLTAAKIMSHFGAYTVEKLLDEPASIFFTLSKLAEKITATKALEIVSAGTNAAINGDEHLRTELKSI